MQTRQSRLRWIVASLVLFLPPGCSRIENSGSSQRFVPEIATARAALDSVLSGWKSAPDPLSESLDQPGVKFVDQQRKPGQRLLGFKILGETDVENARQFIVRLNLDQEEQPRLVRYNIFGRDPIWVYRLEDYELISHWEHKMDDAPAGGEAAGPAQDARKP